MILPLLNAAGQPEAVMCVDRSTQQAVVLKYDHARIGELVSIAHSMKVPRMVCFVPPSEVPHLKDLGWREADNLVVMVKEND